MDLSKQELARYSRHLTLPEVGKVGQAKLKNAKVLIVGAGGLGSPAAIYLAAAGVGTIGIADFDKVDESNLQRQILYTSDDINKSKAEISASYLKRINNNVDINTHDKLTSKNALKIIGDYDVVIDGSDNFPTRYLVNDACVLLSKPDVYGSIFRFDGHLSVFNYHEGPCYRCLFPNPPPKNAVPNCADAGVLGVLPGVIGTMQATEAIKIILGKGKILSGRFLVYDALSMKFRELNLRKNDNCPVCGKNPTVKELIDYENFCGSANMETDEITAYELKKMIDNKEVLEIIDVREEVEWDICRIKGAKLIPLSQIVKGTADLSCLSGEKKTILYCHTGERSAYVLKVLNEMGYKNLKNLAGGIDAWAREVDEGVVVY